MKTFFTILLTLTVAIGSHASELVRGTTLTDGSQLYASDLHNLIDTATVGAGFYTDQQTIGTLATGYYFLIYDPGTGLFRRISAQTMLYGNTNFWNYNTASASIANYGQFLYYDPTNAYLRTISVSNFLSSAASSINVSNLTFGGTNGYKLATAPVFNGFQTNNHPQLLIWGTNGQPYQTSLSNLETVIAADLGTNRGLSYVYAQAFSPWRVYGTNSFTNAWGYNTNFPITGLNVTNAANPSNSTPTLVDADTIPINSTQQSTNTTVTLGAIKTYIAGTNLFYGFTNGTAWTIYGSGAGVTNRWTNTTCQRLIGFVKCYVFDNTVGQVAVSNTTSGFVVAQLDGVQGASNTKRTNTLSFIAMPGDVFQVFTNNPNQCGILTNFWQGL